MLVTCSPCSSLPWASLHPSEAGQAEPASLLLASSVGEALVFHGSFSTGLEPGRTQYLGAEAVGAQGPGRSSAGGARWLHLLRPGQSYPSA